MRKTKFLTAIMAISIAAILNGCAGKDGAPGATGPAGNANVSVSSIVVSPGQWSSDGNGGWTTPFTANGFTNITQAAISIYWSVDDANFAALPFVGYTIGAPDINYTLNASSIGIYYDAQTGVASISQPASTIYFNVVVVPKAIMQRHPNTNWKNANEVAQLPEIKAALNSK